MLWLGPELLTSMVSPPLLDGYSEPGSPVRTFSVAGENQTEQGQTISMRLILSGINMPVLPFQSNAQGGFCSTVIAA